MNWREFIHVMKIDERAARAKYQAAAKAAKSRGIKEIFEKLAYEEDIHIGVLEQFEKDLKVLLTNEKRQKS